MYFGGSLLKTASIALKQAVPDYKDLKRSNDAQKFIPALEAATQGIDALNAEIVKQQQLISELKYKLEKESEVKK